MYLKETIDNFATLSNIIKILKKDAQFNHHCIEERISQGTELFFDKRRDYFYLVQSGYVQYRYEGSSGQNFHFLVRPGNFPFLPIYQEDIPHNSRIEALTDVIWWRIDFAFLKKMLQLEDPRNYILMSFMARTRRELYAIAVQDRLSSKKRIYFSLISLIDLGFRKDSNTVELPIFLTYDRLAELSNTSKGYTSKALLELRENEILISNKKPWVITDVKKLKNLLDADSLPNLF
ncbi:Crp/Fnr family transcriptional regulator [Listeria grandensis]|uniref:Crp/Fnr family transcriptional regulator n=1 Tax=Listeria grandensis TaxID=1494963 RepID=A0A7X1CPL7_9LIST|nr:Crp/Fnr family transcriptional regulator [Listeria grandensis]MBC1473839.1 Crp/Fnr family transcriptional regulator [Listeria grandensis]MBC1936144.1 Crp/Fnr family transcriptional regulator [Listeria grandensis]MBC6316045.1 Crp/Fnr family transcriptional regulator [Listeria grandensis]